VGAGARGARFLLNTDRTTAGRHLGSDIFLDHATVSRSHAVFERKGTQFSVQDLGSLNGTYVNGERTDTALLRSGDRIQIGKFGMVFHQNLSTRSPGPAHRCHGDLGSPEQVSPAPAALRHRAGEGRWGCSRRGSTPGSRSAVAVVQGDERRATPAGAQLSRSFCR
jgi:hypothetical protein